MSQGGLKKVKPTDLTEVMTDFVEFFNVWKINKRQNIYLCRQNPTNPDNAFQDCQTISSAVGYAVADSG